MSTAFSALIDTITYFFFSLAHWYGSSLSFKNRAPLLLTYRAQCELYSWLSNITCINFLIWLEIGTCYQQKLTPWTWVWVDSRSCWWTGRPGVLRFMGSDSRTRLSDWTELKDEISVYWDFSLNLTIQNVLSFTALHYWK